MTVTLTQNETSTLMNAAAYYGNMEMLKYLKLKGGTMELKGEVSWMSMFVVSLFVCAKWN